MPENTFYQDLLKAQQEIEAVDKDGKNPFFKSEYTSLNSTISACKEILNKHNIILLQPIKSTENGVGVCTTLIHTSGEREVSNMVIREAKDHDPQAQGSAITYARRYSLKAMLCMSDADDDGNKAQETYKKPAELGGNKFRVADTKMPPVPNPSGKCPKCDGEMVTNPKTGKIFCKAKCWLN